MDELLKKLVEWLQTASPYLWAILLKQVYVNAAVSFLWSVFIGALTVIAYKSGRYVREEQPCSYSGDNETLSVLLYILSFVLLVLTVVFLTDVVQNVANPEYKAIELILSKLK